MAVDQQPCLCSSGEEGEVRSVLHEQSTALGLGMFALLVQRCTELLRETPAGTHTVTSTVAAVVVALLSHPIQVHTESTLEFSSSSAEP